MKGKKIVYIMYVICDYMMTKYVILTYSITGYSQSSKVATHNTQATLCIHMWFYRYSYV